MTITRQQLTELLHQIDRTCRSEGINPRACRLKCHPRTWNDIRVIGRDAELEDRPIAPWDLNPTQLLGTPVDADPDMAPGVVELTWRHQFLLGDPS